MKKKQCPEALEGQIFVRENRLAFFQIAQGRQINSQLSQGGKMDRRFNLLRGMMPAIKYFPDNWGTRSGLDRRQKNGAFAGPERRRRTERRSGIDRRKLSFIGRRAVFDLREAYRDF